MTASAMPLALSSAAICFLLPLLIEQVAQALQEQHAKDVFLVSRRIHVAAQVVAARKRWLES